MSLAEVTPARDLEAQLQGIMSDVTHLHSELRQLTMEIEPDDISSIRVIQRLVDHMTRDAETIYQNQKRETRNVF